jgi:hypothetical protein
MKNIPIANSYQFMLISYIIEIELGNSMSTQFNANMIDAGEVVNLPHKAQFGRQAETAIGSLFGRQLNTISEGRYVIRTIINTMMSTVTDPGGTLIVRSGRRNSLWSIDLHNETNTNHLLGHTNNQSSDIRMSTLRLIDLA